MTGNRTWLPAAAAVLVAAAAMAQTAPATARAPTTATAPATTRAAEEPGAGWDLSSRPVPATVAAVLTLLGGLVACFYGLRCQKAIFAALGFILGATLAAVVLAGAGPLAAAVAGLIGGVIGALLMYRFYLLAVFVIGLTLGGSLLYAFLSAVIGSANPATMVISILGAIFCGVAAVRLQKMTIVLATSYGGALMAVTALWTIKAAWAAPPAPPSVTAMVVAVAIWLTLGTIGAVIQLAAEARARGVSRERQGEQE
ncbi:MAG TPA: DUF4203 domain-containing protein [Phycisphaerae bacterium]|nr:DUF4203 domain-containing protein [Phycisphaerae bacterium]